MQAFHLEGYKTCCCWHRCHVWKRTGETGLSHVHLVSKKKKTNRPQHAYHFVLSMSSLHLITSHLPFYETSALCVTGCLAFKYSKEIKERTTEWNEPGHLRWDAWCSTVLWTIAGISLLSRLSNILGTATRPNDTRHAQGTSAVLWHKPVRAYLESLLQRCWQHGWDPANVFPFRHSVSLVFNIRHHFAFTTESLDLIGCCTVSHQLHLHCEILSDIHKRTEEIGVDIPQSCFLTHLWDSEWFGFNSVQETARRLHSRVLQVIMKWTLLFIVHIMG